MRSKCLVFLLLLFFASGWRIPEVYGSVLADACSFEIYEAGQKFSGEEVGNGELPRSGSCEKGKACRSHGRCPDTVRFYHYKKTKYQDAKVIFSYIGKDGYISGNKEWDEKQADYFVDIELPPPPADMENYTIGSSVDCDGNRFMGGTRNGFLRTMRVDIKTDETQDLTDYDALRQLRAEDQPKREAACKDWNEFKKKNAEETLQWAAEMKQAKDRYLAKEIKIYAIYGFLVLSSILLLIVIHRKNRGSAKKGKTKK